MPLLFDFLTIFAIYKILSNNYSKKRSKRIQFDFNVDASMINSFRHLQKKKKLFSYRKLLSVLYLRIYKGLFLSKLRPVRP